MEHEPRLPGARVDAMLGAPLTDARQEPAQQRQMNRRAAVGGRRPGPRLGRRWRGAAAGHAADSQLFHRVLELAMHLAPFADAQERQKMLLAGAPELRASAMLLLTYELPQLEQARKIRALVAEALLQLIGFLLQTARAFARFLNVKPRRKHQDFLETAVLGAG